jgi:hypothetical protein
MRDETVKVVVPIPKGIHNFITKLAAAEGSKAEEWYADGIVRDVGALLGNAHDVFDVPRLIRFHGLQKLVGDNP